MRGSGSMRSSLACHRRSGARGSMRRNRSRTARSGATSGGYWLSPNPAKPEVGEIIPEWSATSSGISSKVKSIASLVPNPIGQAGLVNSHMDRVVRRRGPTLRRDVAGAVPVARRAADRGHGAVRTYAAARYCCFMLLRLSGAKNGRTPLSGVARSSKAARIRALDGSQGWGRVYPSCRLQTDKDRTRSSALFNSKCKAQLHYTWFGVLSGWIAWTKAVRVSSIEPPVCTTLRTTAAVARHHSAVRLSPAFKSAKKMPRIFQCAQLATVRKRNCRCEGAGPSHQLLRAADAGRSHSDPANRKPSPRAAKPSKPAARPATVAPVKSF